MGDLTTLEKLLRWPGKSGSDGSPEHPAVYHMLDVASVAERLAAIEPLPPGWREALVLFASLHDLGKIGAEFRAMIRVGATQTFRHWQVTEAHLLAAEGRIAGALALSETAEPAETIRQIFAATAGHHGRPPERPPALGVLESGRSSYCRELREMRRRAGVDACADALRVVEVFLSFWPGASLEGLKSEDARLLSWRLAGLVTAADWIGSNTAWFPAEPRAVAFDEYLEAAREKAAVAVKESGLAAARPRASEAALFDFALRPMQQAARNAALRDGPMLAIIEDETGAGKTEAAMILADRMMRASKGRGLYFALPTMATSDAMFGRLGDVTGNLFDGRPSLALAHGRAIASEAFGALVGGWQRDAATDEPGCAPWLADDRRRTLLADLGVGTIDQALLGVLPTRYSALRLWGLSQKILIIDEAHEYDPYMAREIEALLHAQARQGGSAILMTATLPIAMRRRFAAAFEQGAGRSAEDDPDRSYPALRVIGRPVVRAPASSRLRPRIAVLRCPSEAEAVDLVRAAVAEGAAVAWVRNAVDDALRGQALLEATETPCDLLHARFALCDRLTHEAAVRATFGRSRPDKPGRALVGTQVLESSLDLDFDLMVTDIAPMASVIQRAGRLWRHMDRRPQDARPVDGPTLHVLSPDPDVVDGPRWLQGALEAGAWIYPQTVAWRTAKVLFAAGGILAPDDLRDLVEAVHGAEAAPAPAALEGDEREAEGEDQAKRTHAGHNIVAFDEGYSSAQGVWDDTDYPTRLGRPQTTLLLMRAEAGKLRPWAGGDARDPKALMLSEVRADAARMSRLSLPDQAEAPIATVTEGWPDWRRGSVRVCPVGEDGRICNGLSYSSMEGLGFLDHSGMTRGGH